MPRPSDLRRLACLTLLAAPTLLAPVQATPCPDLSGHYRVDGFGPTLGTALEVLGAQMAGFTGSEVRIRSDAHTVSLWLKSGSSSPMPSQPSRVLQAGSDFVCENGAYAFKRSVPASRQTDKGWLEGTATLRLSPGARAGLQLGVTFTGRQRSTIYSYDSARISLPKWGTGATLGEGIRWPNIADATEPVPVPPSVKEVPEAPELARVRQLLGRELLGNVILGGLSPKGEAVRVTLKALRSEDIPALEDRLRAAALPYQMAREPIWTNGAYHLELLLWPEGQAPKGAGRPSAHRVQQELDRLRPALVDVQKVEQSGDSYIASYDLLGAERMDSVVARIRLNSTMFSEIVVLSESQRADRPNLRTARVRFTLR